jgi:hypothetical protein
MVDRLICFGTTKLAELVINFIILSILRAKNHISRIPACHIADKGHASAFAPIGRMASQHGMTQYKRSAFFRVIRLICFVTQ